MAPRRRTTPLFTGAPSLVATLAAVLSLSACATPCERVQTSRDAFRRATAPAAVRGGSAAQGAAAQGAHISVSVPFEIIDAVTNRELSRLPSLSLPTPAVSGYSLGALRLGVDSVRTQAAPDGLLGFRIVVSLRQGKRTALRVNLDARVRPRLNPDAGVLTVSLSGEDLVSLDASMAKGGAKLFADFIWAQLPDAARMVLDKGAIAGLTAEVGDELLAEATRQVKAELLDDLGELVRFDLDLPEELPIDAIALSSQAPIPGESGTPGTLDLDLRTPLSVDAPLPPGHARAAGMHPNLIQVRVSGASAAALANHALREGRLPQRWTLEGEADPKGPIQVGAGWAEGAADPLELHLWALGDAAKPNCAYVILRSVPELAVVPTNPGSANEGSAQLELSAGSTRVESVVGSFKVRAGLFFNKAAVRGASLAERTAARTELELGGRAMALEVYSAERRGDEFVLGLRLAPRR